VAVRGIRTDFVGERNPRSIKHEPSIVLDVDDESVDLGSVGDGD
jgi:hypothetical protein